MAGQCTGVKVGDRVVGVANGTLVGDWLVVTGDETGSTGTGTGAANGTLVGRLVGNLDGDIVGCFLEPYLVHFVKCLLF